MRAAHKKLEVTRNRTHTLHLTIKVAGVVLDLTGWKVRTQVRALRSYESRLLIEVPSTIIDAAAGTVDVVFTSALTKDIVEQRGSYEVLLQDGDGENWPYLRGNIEFGDYTTVEPL